MSAVITTIQLRDIMMQYYSSEDSQEHWHGFLLSAVTLGTHRELVESLRDMSAAEVLVAVNHRDGRGYTAIVWAALLGHRDDVELLLQSGADKDACSFSGLSALQGAAEKVFRLDCVPQLFALMLEPRAMLTYV